MLEMALSNLKPTLNKSKDLKLLLWVAIDKTEFYSVLFYINNKNFYWIYIILILNNFLFKK
jgi:hypothetical protein